MRLSGCCRHGGMSGHKGTASKYNPSGMSTDSAHNALPLGRTGSGGAVAEPQSTSREGALRNSTTC